MFIPQCRIYDDFNLYDRMTEEIKEVVWFHLNKK